MRAYSKWLEKRTLSVQVPLMTAPIWMLICTVTHIVSGVERLGLLLIFVLLSTALGVCFDVIDHRSNRRTWRDV